jgi:predicted ArsR family transcriptional regulator
VSDEITVLDSIAVRDDFDDGIKRCRDIDLGVMLGMAQPANVRATILKHAEELKEFGVLTQRVKTSSESGGRPTKEYWLNKDQSIFVAGRSDTKRGRDTYKMLVKAFGVLERSIAATAVYTGPALRSDNVQILELGRDWLIDLGVHRGIATSAALRDAEANSGLSLAHIARALPAVAEDLGGMNATQLAERVGTTAVKMNRQLESLGLQERTGKEWTLTEAGKRHADAFPYTRNGHSSLQIKWRDSVISVLEARQAGAA